MLTTCDGAETVEGFRRKRFIKGFPADLLRASLRLNGSLNESCDAELDIVDATILFDFSVSSAIFLALINRNSRSIRNVRPLSMNSNDSSVIGSSASICCFI